MMENLFSIDKFKLQPIRDLESLPLQDTKFCIVSIIGKSRYNLQRSKATFVNLLADANIFGEESGGKFSVSNLCRLEGYCDVDRRVLFIHLLSSCDMAIMSNICQLVEQDVTQNGYAGVLRMAEFSHTRALLFTFLVSHIILLVHPGGSFDTSYVRLFRTLDAVRLKIQSNVTDLLKRLCRSNMAVKISKDWVVSGRPCSPRLLFVFEGCHVSEQEEDTTGSGSRSQKVSASKSLQHAIEDQIYRILRKARIITNTSNNSLFAVPANQEFVYIQPRRTDTNDLASYYMEQLRNSCGVHKFIDPTAHSRSYRQTRRAATTSQSLGSVDSEDGTHSTVGVHASSSSTERVSTPNFHRSADRPSNSFTEFLLPHIELALTRGFDDNVGRNPVAAIFELPTLAEWFAIAEQLHPLFWADVSATDSRTQSHFGTLKSLTDIDVRFSESRCSKVLPLATAFYQDGLPPHYIRAVHLAKLQQAKRVFTMQARGPACERYLEQLEQECERLWRNGRQMCEEISLTGNHCVNELHRVIEMSELTEEMRRLPVMSHSSQMKTRATCNCGRRQADREDPFDHRSANFEFYDRLEHVCCLELIHYDLSVFKPSTSDVRPASSAPLSRRVDDLAPKSPKVSSSLHKNLSKYDMASLSLALSELSQPDDIFRQQAERTRSVSGDRGSIDFDKADSGDESEGDNRVVGQDVGSGEEPVDVEVTEADSPHNDNIVVVPPSVAQRQHSTTEYLPGMLHTESLPGLLPKFPSWSLLMLGEYTSYSPMQGLDQPGFTHGCNFLLPIDVSVKIDRERWSACGDAAMQAKKGYKFRKGTRDLIDVTMRLFVGLEYECPRGHRFFMCAPDRIFRVPQSGIYKETAHRVINHDMPLYFPCTCRSAKLMIGQLMRVYVAVPDGPVEAKIRPKVQPGPTPCPLFFPEADDPLVLPPGLWILRLPYVYLGENGVYRMPTNEPQNIQSSKFVRGFLSIGEASSIGS